MIKQVTELFSFRSIRGRFLLTALSFIIYLLVMAVLSQKMVNESHHASIDNSTQHRTVKQNIQQITGTVSQLNLYLHRYLISPSDDVKKDIQRYTTHTRQYLDSLLQNDWVHHSHDTLTAVKNISLLFEQLANETSELITIRNDPLLLFPASPIMENIMLPASNAVLMHLELALDDAEPQKNQKHAGVRNDFEDLRLTWVRLISSYRMFVASRFGIFPSANLGPQNAQQINVEIYATHFGDVIKRLQANQKALGFQQEQALDEIKKNFNDWMAGFEKAMKYYGTNNWRRDIPTLNQVINPLFQQMWGHINFLEEKIDRSSSRDLENLSTTSALLTRFFWAVAAIGMILTVFGIFFFNTMIRKPLQYVSTALHAQANGQVVAATLRGSTTETRYLFQAFDHMQQEVNKREQRLQAILDNAAEGIFTIDADGVLESANKAMQRLTGFSEQELLGQPVTQTMPQFFEPFPLAKSQATVLKEHLGVEQELTARTKSGRFIPVAVLLSEFTLQGRCLYIGLAADISERKAIMKHLQYVAEHDDLTELKNRAFFYKQLDVAVTHAALKERQFALLYVDLDNFKYVNDTLSHAAGDHLLQEVVRTMQQNLPDDALLARFGGDEFTILFHTASADGAWKVAEKIRHRLSTRLFFPQGRQINLTCSIGVVFIDHLMPDAESALSKVDLACHVAKRGGRNRVHLFNPQNQQDVSSMENDMSWSRTIKYALENNRFLLALQPIIDVKSRRMHSYEVLLRLLDENGEILMPGGFLPVAERYGLASEIDKWVIRNAFQALAQLNKQGKNLSFNLNLSGQTLADEGICDTIANHLAKNKLDPAWVTFEVTETIAIENMQLAQNILRQIQKLGCRTALDDFGVGMSSFAYLQDLPVNSVKIDGRFIKDLAGNEVNSAMVRAMNDVAHALGKTTVAEFVQNEISMELLGQIGVDYAQGYYLGKPELVRNLIAEKLLT